jgi:hypothetical protein
MLDERIGLTVVRIPSRAAESNHLDLVKQAEAQAERLRRPVDFQWVDSELGPGLVGLAVRGGYDLVVLSEPDESTTDTPSAQREDWLAVIRTTSPCPVLVGWRSLPLGVKDD